MKSAGEVPEEQRFSEPLAGDRLSLAESRARLEADRICRVLRQVGNNRTQAAIQLGISRTMLYKKIAKYGLSP